MSHTLILPQATSCTRNRSPTHHASTFVAVTATHSATRTARELATRLSLRWVRSLLKRAVPSDNRSKLRVLQLAAASSVHSPSDTNILVNKHCRVAKSSSTSSTHFAASSAESNCPATGAYKHNADVKPSDESGPFSSTHICPHLRFLGSLTICHDRGHFGKLHLNNTSHCEFTLQPTSTAKLHAPCHQIHAAAPSE